MSGVIKIETNWSKKVSPVDMMHLINMEGTVWLYDLDNDKVFFMGDPVSVEDLVYNHTPDNSYRVAEAIIAF